MGSPLEMLYKANRNTERKEVSLRIQALSLINVRADYLSKEFSSYKF